MEFFSDLSKGMAKERATQSSGRAAAAKEGLISFS